MGASHLCKYSVIVSDTITLRIQGRGEQMMNEKDSRRMEACIQEVAEILYRNTSTKELTSFERIEQAVRTKMLEEVSPKVAFFLSNKLQGQKRGEKE